MAFSVSTKLCQYSIFKKIGNLYWPIVCMLLDCYSPSWGDMWWRTSVITVPDTLTSLFVLYFSFPSVPYRIFLLFLLWLPCHFYLVVIEQQQDAIPALSVSVPLVECYMKERWPSKTCCNKFSSEDPVFFHVFRYYPP